MHTQDLGNLSLSLLEVFLFLKSRMKSSVVTTLLLLVSASASEFSLADLSAALDSDDACTLNGQPLECALELAQLKVARRHRDAPEVAAPAAPEAEEVPAEAPAEEPQQPETPGNAGAEVAPPADYGHPEWLSDCKRVFVDLGCNNGVNIRKLYEPKKFPDAKLLSAFDESMGSAGWRRAKGKQNGLCAIGLEPNPEHFDRLQKLQAAYEQHGWHVHFYPFAAWNVEGMMSFNKTTQRPSEIDTKTAAGAHLMMRLDQEANPQDSPSQEVRTVNAAEFLNSLPGGSVKLVVMDIEGAEYETLAQMMQENVLCANTVEKLLLETHGWGDVTHWGGPDSFTNGVHPRSFAAVTERVTQLKGVDWCKPGALSKIEEFDDATYSEDVDDKFAQWR